MSNSRALIRETVSNVRAVWKALALTDISYKIIAFILLTPLVGILFRTLIALSGRSILADQDVLYFFLGPVGWLCLIGVGALWLAIAALEQAALMAVLGSDRHQPIGLVAALRFAWINAWPVIQVAGRLVAWLLLTMVPFLALAAGAYFLLLTESDINYYLKEQPPVFWLALGIGGVLATTCFAVIVYLLTRWSFALPLVLFEHVRPAAALRTSSERTAGHRRALLLWLLAWIVATFLLSTVATAAVFGLGRLIVPHATGSVTLLLFAIGATLFLWASVNLAVNLLSNTSFAALLFNLYKHLGNPADVAAFGPTVASVAAAAQRQARFHVTPGRLLAAAVIGLLAAAAVGALAVRTVQIEDHTQIMAHRGASHAAPENTLAAVRQAIQDGADWVEIDVQETADGQVVVFHDSDFMRLAGNPLAIWDATMQDLQQLDIGSWYAPEFSDERVPTLAAVLDECQGKIGVNVELKYYGHDEQLEQRVVDIVEAHGMAPHDVVFMSLKLEAVQKMKALRPDWQVGLLMSVLAGRVRDIQADFLAVNAATADRPFIRSAHASDKKVGVWTVNDAATMSRMIGQRVDFLITDRPALARAVLEQRASLSPPERLLLQLAELLGAAPRLTQQ